MNYLYTASTISTVIMTSYVMNQKSSTKIKLLTSTSFGLMSSINEYYLYNNFIDHRYIIDASLLSLSFYSEFDFPFNFNNYINYKSAIIIATAATIYNIEYNNILNYILPLDLIAEGLNVLRDLSSIEANKKLDNLLFINRWIYYSAGLYFNVVIREQSKIFNLFQGLYNFDGPIHYDRLNQVLKNILYTEILVLTPFLITSGIFDIINNVVISDFQSHVRRDLLNKSVVTKDFLSINKDIEHSIKVYLDSVPIIMNTLLSGIEGQNNYGLISDQYFLIPRIFILSELDIKTCSVIFITTSMNKIFNFISAETLEYRQIYSNLNKELEAYLDKLSLNSKQYDKSISLMGGINKTAENILYLEDQYSINLLKLKTFNSINTIINNFYKYKVNEYTVNFSLIWLIYKKSINGNDFYKIKETVQGFSDALCLMSNPTHQSNIQHARYAIDKLKEIDHIFTNNVNLDFKDVIFNIDGSSQGIAIQHISFMRGSSDKKIYIDISDIELNFGKFYLVSGANGIGKSSFFDLLLFIKQKIYDNTFKNISYNITVRSDNIDIIPQVNYCPFNSTLKDIIFYPQNHNELLDRIKDIDIISLANKLSVYSLALSSQELYRNISNICNELSGGQIKKLLLIKHILLCTDVLILDEFFAPLDHSSKLLISKILKEESCMKEKLVIAIHHTESNNYDAEYLKIFDYQLQFDNNTIYVNDMSYV